MKLIKTEEFTGKGSRAKAHAAVAQAKVGYHNHYIEFGTKPFTVSIYEREPR